MNQQQHRTFRNHPFIQSIQDNPKWTISNEEKVPIDMNKLMTENRLRGASFYDEQSLTTLPKISDFFGQFNQHPTNYAYYLDVMLDGFVVLDIEKDCPDETKARLLSTSFTYGEYSLSGRGYHLVYPTPKCFMDYPNAHPKPSIRNEDNTYEVLLNHFVTFTGNIITPPAHPANDFDEIYRELATTAKNIAKRKEVDITTLTEKPDTEYADRILDILLRAGRKWTKSPDNFKKEKRPMENDTSRYEWSYIAFLKHKLDSIRAVSAIKAEHEYTEEEQAYFLYAAIQELLPHRDKHDEYRTVNDTRLPWLGYLVKDVLEKVTEDDAQ